MYDEAVQKEAAAQRAADPALAVFEMNDAETERDVAGQFRSMILYETVGKEMTEMMALNPVVHNEAEIGKSITHYTKKMLLEAAVGEKIAGLSESEKSEIVENEKNSRFSYDEDVAEEIQNQNMQGFLKDPKNKNTLAQMRMDNDKAQGILKEMKKAGKETPHIDEVYEQVKNSRVKNSVETLKQERMDKNMAMMAAVKNRLQARK